MSRSFKLTIAYDGTGFAGWQVQPGQPTIQDKLQSALARIVGQPVQVIGSGRTDSGVHAIAQVASCTLPDWRHTADSLRKALNARLPETIVVQESVDAPDGFHAIRDAIGKRYRFQLQIGGTRDVFEFPYRWHLQGRIDTEQMRAAAARFLGTHDFAGFQKAGSDRKTTIREIRACELIPQQLPADCDDDGRLHFALEIEANGFLYNMVRNIVGTLTEVGRGRRDPQWIDQVIAGKDRDLAGQTAPAHALFLLRVDYPEF